MTRKQENFEVHACRDGRWTIESTEASQPEAEAYARKVLAKTGVTGVRVIREVARGSTSRESVVFEQTRETGGSGKIFVNDIDEAPPCDSADELYAGQGRLTINRLFRAYLDKQGVTATEVMHDFRELRRLMDTDTLIASGVGKASVLQAKSLKEGDASTRRDALYAMLNEVSTRARTASEMKLPAIRKDGFDAAISAVIATAAPDKCDFLLRVIVSRELVQQRSFFGKLAQTMDWTEPATEPRALALADTFVSDILANSETLQDLLGTQSCLGDALSALVDLAKGSRQPQEAEHPLDSPEGLADRLNALLGRDALPDSRMVLVDRMRRQLEGKNPLARGEPEQEQETFRGLIDKLMPNGELFGGSAIAEALTHRQARMLNKGGVAGLKEATGSLLPTLVDPVRKATYLLSLSESRLAPTIGDEIVSQIDALFVQPQSVRQIIRDNRPPNKKMAAVTAVYHKIKGSNLDDGLKTRVTARLDELLASYIVDDHILDKIDDPGRPLHVRAFMLLTMCTPEVLPEGKASHLARQIIVKHLRRPNFETELVAQVAPAEKDRVLRDFHVQLYRCGFMQ
jgi:hypothetical protein